jgi:Rieske Fe-S protein
MNVRLRLGINCRRALAAASYPFVASLAPSERANAAGAPVEFDVAPLVSGQLRTIEWRGTPVWILRRTAEMWAGLEGVERPLIDPRSEVCPTSPRARNGSRRAMRPFCSGCARAYRAPGSPMGMPPKGGNPSLTDADLKAVLDYIKETFAR